MCRGRQEHVVEAHKRGAPTWGPRGPRAIRCGDRPARLEHNPTRTTTLAAPVTSGEGTRPPGDPGGVPYDVGLILTQSDPAPGDLEDMDSILAGAVGLLKEVRASSTPTTTRGERRPGRTGPVVDTPRRRAFMGRWAERGWLGMTGPRVRRLRGEGAYEFLLDEQLAGRGGPQIGKGVGIIGKTLIRHGNDTLKAEFLPEILRDEVEFAVGYGANPGSDAASMQLKATRDDGGWLLDGQKTWTTSALSPSGTARP